jgi:hypothetical protein
VENINVIGEGHLENFFWEIESYVFCITITDLRSLTLEVGKPYQFSHEPIKDRYRWKAMVLWVHEITLTSLRQPYAERSSGQQYRVSVLFSLLEFICRKQMILFKQHFRKNLGSDNGKM